MRTLITLTAMIALTGCPKSAETLGGDAWVAPDKNAGVPDRPEQISFDTLEYSPPQRDDYRHTLQSGVPVYIAESHEFPLVQISFTFKGGRYLEPEDRIGVAGAARELVRHGGAGDLGAEETDEMFAFLAADVGLGVSAEQSSATLNVTTANFDEAFALFMDMLREPGLDAAKLDLWKTNTIERMKERNDDAGDIIAREWSALAYGRDHYLGRTNTDAGIGALTVEDVRAFHGQLFHPGNLLVSVTGDVTPDEIIPKLDAALDGWAQLPRAVDPPAPTASLEPGLYHVEKDIPQGKLFIGLPGINRDHPDWIPLMVMNDILGAGGFTSRLMKRIRSDEGLAYGARSAFRRQIYFPGVFQCNVASKNPTVALSGAIMVEEIRRITTEPVAEEELALAKTSFIDTFPRRFENSRAVVSTFVNDELTRRDPGYWDAYREQVEAVTADEVLRVAQAHLDPDALTILVVGKWSELAPGDHEGRAKMADLGEVTHLPLRDPLTQAPIE